MSRLPLAAAALLAAALPACTAAPPPPYAPYRAVQPAASGPDQILALHNAERARFGVAPLRWSPALAAAANGYSGELARSGRFRHSSNAARGDQGENLWMGTAGAFGTAQMVGSWIGERRDFRPGRFPSVSRTGRWSDVGHYTQMIWPTTREVGCSVRRGNGNDWLVCRYAPAGNINGRSVP